MNIQFQFFLIHIAPSNDLWLIFIIQLQDAHKCLLGDLYVTELTHTFLALFLLL